MRRSVTSAAALCGVVLVMASCVGNPGEFELGMHEGSTMEVVDAELATTFSLGIGVAPCADGLDNDLDGMSDLNDADCASPDDANERLAGSQSYAPSVLPMDVDAAGTITLDPTEVAIQEIEFCPLEAAGEAWCLGLTVEGVGSVATGAVTPDGITIPWSTVINMRALSGFPDLGDDCVLVPAESTLTGAGYDEVTGAVDLTRIVHGP